LFVEEIDAAGFQQTQRQFFVWHINGLIVRAQNLLEKYQEEACI